MPPTWKDKGSRLQAFARGNSDGGANPSAAAPKPEAAAEKRSETPQDGSHVPSRQELADAARLHVPSGLPNGVASHHQQNGSRRSPPRLTQTSPTRHRARRDSEDRRNQLFSGSQLGEGFMNSGLSTPQNEAADSEDEATPNARRAGGRVGQNHVKDMGNRLPSGGGPAFRLEDNGMMTVVAEKARGAAPLMMMDCFRDDAVSADKRYLSKYMTTTLQPKVQLREVRVKRLPASGQSAHFANREAGSPSASVESGRWQTQGKRDEQPRLAMAVSDSEEEVEPVGRYGESTRTSKPNKAGGGARRRMGGSSTPANIALQKLPRDRKRRRGSADYDDRILSSMTYKDLEDEPFDLDPATATGQNGHDGPAKLPLKLEQHRQQGETEQVHMFATMSIDDWEASGDWFSEQFAGITKRLMEARRSKRRMVRAFEDEAARREEAVRLRSEMIDGKLAKMRQDGQRVVQDKRQFRGCELEP